MTVVQPIGGISAAATLSDPTRLLEEEAWQAAEAAARERLLARADADDAAALVAAVLAQGQFAAAEALASEWLEVFVDDPRLLTARAEARARLGRHQDALRDAHRAVLLAAEEPAAWVGLAEALWTAGERKDAQDAFLTALASGEHAPAAFRAACFWRDQGQVDDGLKALREIETMRPLTAAELWCVALLNKEAGNEREAASAFRSGLCTATRRPPVSVLIAAAEAYLAARQHEDALATIDRALAQRPDDPDLASQRISALRELDRNVEAIEDAERLLPRLSGDQKHALLLTLSNLHSRIGEHREALSYLEACDASGIALSLSELAMVINHEAYGSDDGGRLLKRALKIRERARSVERIPLLFRTERQRRLRVGLLSNSFGCHPVGWLTVGAFEALDQERFEIICFSTMERRDDPIARRFRLLASEYVVLEGLSDDAAVQDMARRGLDVLIELQGYSARSRMELVIRKPAPVVLKWVGMQGYSSGLEAIDATIADDLEVPPELEPLYTERILRLPRSYISYSVPDTIPDVAPCPFEQNGYVTFGFFNNLQKMSDAWLAAAARILAAVPDSRLLIKTRGLCEPKARERFEGRLLDQRIPLERCDIAGRTPHFEHLRAVSSVDIALDSFPYTGGLTTLECALMGVPTVARFGTSFASRHSLSHLTNLGLADLCAESDEAFIANAVGLAQDKRRLADLRRTLRSRLLEPGGLCDHARAARGLEDAILAAVTEHKDTRPVAVIASPRSYRDACRAALPATVEEEIGRALKALWDKAGPIFDPMMSMENEALIIIALLLGEKKPKKVLEFGSGISSLLLNSIEFVFSPQLFVSVDDSPEWQKKVSAYVQEKANTLFLCKELVKIEWGSTIGSFYSISDELKNMGPFDAIIIDGPIQLPGKQEAMNRAMAGTVLRELGRPGTLIILDDAWRRFEMAGLRLWHENGLVVNPVIYDTRRGLAVMQLR